MTSMSGATGGSPPAARRMRVGRSGGMLNGISTSSRPAVPTRWTRWSSSICVEHVNVAWRPPKSSTADVRTSVPNRGIAPDRGHDLVRLAVEHPAGDVDRVAADVHQRPAAELGDVADVGRIDVAVGEEGLDRQQLADRTARRRARGPDATAGGGGT